MRLEYDCGFLGHAEWVCFEHQGVARAKAEKWWRDMRGRQPAPATVDEALERAEAGEIARPSHIVVKQEGKFTRVASRRFLPDELDRVRAYVPLRTVERENARWWRVLGISETADEHEVKAAYRQLAREHHPDAGGTHAAMANINRAYAEGLRAAIAADIPF
ncbi:J domain-containing protein [Methylobacterium oryzisoli]|uniref:J domain-containing protein n=1 Tax=Methylobacterium oryzisoli TaxID=3385502 RepID=UPI003892939F